MNFISRFFVLILCCSVVFSCKNELKSANEKEENSSKESVIVPNTEKKEVTKKKRTKEEESQITSVMLKTMVTPELKTFSSMLVTVGLGDLLSKNKGPFTIIGASNESFTSLGELQLSDLLNTENIDDLKRLIKGHIIEGNLDATALINKIEEGNGSFELISMSGATYVVTRDGATILITDVNGVEARVLKSDLKGANGVVHVIDSVLGLN